MIPVNRHIAAKLFLFVLILPIISAKAFALSETGGEESKLSYYEEFSERFLGAAIISGFSSSKIGKGQNGWTTGGQLDFMIYERLRLTYVIEKIYYAKEIEGGDKGDIIKASAMEALENGVGMRYEIDILPVIPYLGFAALFARFDTPSFNRSDFYFGWGFEFGFDVPVNDIVSLGLRSSYSSYRGLDVSFPAVSNLGVAARLRQF
ncbi:MAG: hypothetical protein Kow0090_15480 [Myxococcota bacterium]